MKRFLLMLFTLIILTGNAQATADKDGYQMPPKLMADLVDAPRRPSFSLSADKKWLAILKRPAAPAITELAEPEKKLAGLKINPLIFAPSRSQGADAITLRQINSDKSYTLDDLPEGKILDVTFSPDGKYLSFVLEKSSGLELWLHEIKAQRSKRLGDFNVHATLGWEKYEWLSDSSAILTRRTVYKAEEAPTLEKAFIKPIIQESTGKKAAVRTYSNLLKTPYDEKLFEFLSTSQLVQVSVNGKVKNLGKPGLIYGYSASPDASLLLITQIQKPFSYMVPYYQFPNVTEVWDRQGKVIRSVAELPSGEFRPQGFDAVIEGRRSVSWRPDKAATLYWYEALDGGDMKKDVTHHDSVHQWSAPFKKQPQLLVKTKWRMSFVDWANDEFALLNEWRFSDRQTRVWKFSPAAPKDSFTLFDERSYNDRYKDPGDPVYERNQYGRQVIKLVDNNVILLTGIGASPKGNIPFVDEYDFRTKKKTRIWESQAPYYERAFLPINDAATAFLTSRESKTEPPNIFKRNIKSGELTQLSFFPHPTPAFKDIKKEFIKYKRADGVELSGNLYLPLNYKPEDGPLPVLMWAYPQEFKDQSVAGQVTESPYEFVRVSYFGPLAHLAQGFAVFDDPKMPIVGVGDTEPNDSFRKQLVMSAQAAVDVLVKRGVADPKRIAIAGHSYGAFMVANLLAHSDLFAAGIARSGAYNRSLTPFGFQGEERDFWKGQQTYINMSPFFHAEKIDEPMLMIHGSEDPNSGTYPMQSERMFAALKGLGANARLVMLPYEQHGYQARESLMHMLWEQYQWLEAVKAKTK